MEISIADQIALDDALVAPADRLKIGKCNLRLSSDVTSKEATLQVVYDVLKLTPFYKAFQVTADAPEIYMQEFWASSYVHNRSVRFKMNNKKKVYMVSTILTRNETTQLYGAILPVALTNEDIRNSESYKEYYARASGTIPPKTKGSKKKANTDIITQQKPPTAPKEKKSGKGKQKRLQADAYLLRNWCLHQDDEQAQDDEDAGKNDVNETTQDDEDDDDHDDDETVQEDDDEELTESDDDGDDFVHPKLTTHVDDIIHEEETDEDDSRIFLINQMTQKVVHEVEGAMCWSKVR
ncbi:hypothetical protein Tco_1546256 [Tanacetum coccineum]